MWHASSDTDKTDIEVIINDHFTFLSDGTEPTHLPRNNLVVER
jgi:hypothetical protein